MTLSARGADSSHRDPVLESVGADLNNPPFSGSPGRFHAHLLTAGMRSSCPFSTNTLTTLTTGSTRTKHIHGATHTASRLPAVGYDMTFTCAKRQEHSDSSSSWNAHTHTGSILSSRGLRAEQVCSLSVFHLWFKCALPSSRANFLSASHLVSKQVGMQTDAAHLASS